jgi:hypothetical protein
LAIKKFSAWRAGAEKFVSRKTAFFHSIFVFIQKPIVESGGRFICEQAVVGMNAAKDRNLADCLQSDGAVWIRA